MNRERHPESPPPEPSAVLRRVHRRVARNILLGTLVSFLPAFAFYSAAFSPLLLLAAALRVREGAAPAPVGWSELGLLVAGVAALNLLLLLLFAVDIRRQTSALLGGLTRVEQDDLAARVDLYSPDEFGRISAGVNRMIRGLRERDHQQISGRRFDGGLRRARPSAGPRARGAGGCGGQGNRGAAARGGLGRESLRRSVSRRASRRVRRRLRPGARDAGRGREQKPFPGSASGVRSAGSRARLS